MISNALTSPAYAYSPDADRVGRDASVRLLHRLPLLDLLRLLYGLVRFLVLVAFLVREYWLVIHEYRAGTQPLSRHSRSDLPPGPAQQPASSIRAPVGNAIAWICPRRGIAPGRKDWLKPFRAVMAFGSSKKSSRPANMNFVDHAIVAFGSALTGFRPHSEEAAAARRVAFGRSTKGSRPGLPSCGLQSLEKPNIPPGAIGDIVETPAVPDVALLLSRRKVYRRSAPTQGMAGPQGIAGRASAWPAACVAVIRVLAALFPILDQSRSAERAAAIPRSQFSCV